MAVFCVNLHVVNAANSYFTLIMFYIQAKKLWLLYETNKTRFEDQMKKLEAFYTAQESKFASGAKADLAMWPRYTTARTKVAW